MARTPVPQILDPPLITLVHSKGCAQIARQVRRCFVLTSLSHMCFSIIVGGVYIIHVIVLCTGTIVVSTLTISVHCHDDNDKSNASEELALLTACLSMPCYGHCSRGESVPINLVKPSVNILLPCTSYRSTCCFRHARE